MTVTRLMPNGAPTRRSTRRHGNDQLRITGRPSGRRGAAAGRQDRRGRQHAGHGPIAVARLNPNGSPDATFGGMGKATVTSALPRSATRSRFSRTTGSSGWPEDRRRRLRGSTPARLTRRVLLAQPGGFEPLSGSRYAFAWITLPFLKLDHPADGRFDLGTALRAPCADPSDRDHPLAKHRSSPHPGSCSQLLLRVQCGAGTLRSTLVSEPHGVARVFGESGPAPSKLGVVSISRTPTVADLLC